MGHFSTRFKPSAERAGSLVRDPEIKSRNFQIIADVSL